MSMMFGVGSLMLFVATGIAIDISGVTKQDRATQDLADMAVLAAAASGYQELTDLQTIAENTVNANTKPGESFATILSITPQNAIQVEVRADYEMVIMGWFGHENSLVTNTAEAPPRGDGKLNLAMVLDVTGSMQGSKLTALQTAANELVDTFDVARAASSGNVMMSVVPFAHYVKIPVSNLGQPWLEVEPTAVHNWEYDLNECNTDGADDPTCVPDLVPRSDTLSWNGCMGSRHAPYHITPDFGTSRLQGFAARGSCRSELLPLTTDFTAIRNNISGLTAEYETYIPSGLTWGWRTLSPNAPFTEADTADKNERKRALLLMTDGENTYSYGGTNPSFNGVYHWEEDQVAADAMTTQMCTDIKADGITIYTVAFEVTDASTQNMLRNCASDPGKYYDARSSIELETAFGSIGDELAEVRLSR